MVSFTARFYAKYRPALGVAAALMKAAVTGKRAPLYVGLFITERCNLKCVYCFPDSPNRRVKDPDIKTIFGLVDELYSLGTRYITLLGGEPMIREDFNEIVRYITAKGILTECGTNGYFTARRIDALKKLHCVCHSIDGDEAAHDMNRGKGSYARIIESLRLCRLNGIPVQMRAVFNRNNAGSLMHLLKLGRELGTSLALAEQAVVKPGDKDLAMTAGELRGFWISVRDCKRQGWRIDKSYALLDRIIDYPIEASPEKIFKKGEAAPSGGYFPLCGLSRGYAFIDADGFMYPCALLFGKFGKNVFSHGLKEAWDYLEERPCLFCRQSVQDLKSWFFSGDIRARMTALKNFIEK